LEVTRSHVNGAVTICQSRGDNDALHRLSSDAQIFVDAIGIASVPIRLTLPAEIAAANRGKTLPINFVVRTTVYGGDENKQEKSTFYVLP